MFVTKCCVIDYLRQTKCAALLLLKVVSIIQIRSYQHRVHAPQGNNLIIWGGTGGGGGGGAQFKLFLYIYFSSVLYIFYFFPPLICRGWGGGGGGGIKILNMRR